MFTDFCLSDAYKGDCATQVSALVLLSFLKVAVCHIQFAFAFNKRVGRGWSRPQAFHTSLYDLYDQCNVTIPMKVCTYLHGNRQSLKLHPVSSTIGGRQHLTELNTRMPMQSISPLNKTFVLADQEFNYLFRTQPIKLNDTRMNTKLKSLSLEFGGHSQVGSSFRPRHHF